MAKIFVEALQIKMSGKTIVNTSNGRYLEDLLSQETSFQVKSLAIASLSKKLKGHFRLMVTPIGKGAAQKAYAHTAVTRLAGFYRNTVSTIYEDCIVTLFGEMEVNDSIEKERSFLMAVAESLKISYSGNGISGVFKELSEITGYYKEAYYTVMLYPYETSFYEDVAPEPLFMLLVALSPMAVFYIGGISCMTKSGMNYSYDNIFSEWIDVRIRSARWLVLRYKKGTTHQSSGTWFSVHPGYGNMS